MAVFNVQYTKRPFLTLQGLDAALPWDEGSLFTYRMKSSAMQLSATSLQYYSGDTLRALESWDVFTCTPTVRALCTSQDTRVALMGTSPVVVPDDLSGPMAASQFLRSFGGSVCNAQDTGRLLGQSDVYTVSMCDLSERMLRFVVRDTEAGMLVYWKAESTPVVENVVLALIALYASVNIANNTVSLISASSAQRASSAGVSYVLVLTAASFALFVVCQRHADYYVYAHDYSLYVALVTYLLLEVSLLCLKLSQTSRKAGKLQDRFHFGYNINISAVMLLLVTLPLHQTFATPFFGVLFAVFGVRTTCKLLQQMDDHCRSHCSLVNLVSVLVDLLVWSFMLAYGLAISDDVYAQLAIAANVMVGLMLGFFMVELVERRQTKACSSV
jgi:hypothetical protein